MTAMPIDRFLFHPHLRYRQRAHTTLDVGQRTLPKPLPNLPLLIGIDSYLALLTPRLDPRLNPSRSALIHCRPGRQLRLYPALRR